MATITEIKAEQLRHSDTPEGLILQAAAGIWQEWVTGINDNADGGKYSAGREPV